MATQEQAARVNAYFDGGGSNHPGTDQGDLVWNPQTGCFDVERPATAGRRQTEDVGVMKVVAREGHFASPGPIEDDVEEVGPAEADLVFDPVTNEFQQRVETAQPVPTAAAVPVTVDAVAEPETTPGESAGVMRLLARDGHFVNQELPPRMKRLTMEYQILSQNFNKGHAKICKMTPDTVILTYKNKYGLTLKLPPNYPNEMPRIFITHPEVLRAKDGHVFANVSHDDHTLSRVEGLGTQVCHSREEVWTPANALVQVVFKAFMWLDAYEKHHVTGHPIAHYLGTQAPRS